MNNKPQLTLYQVVLTNKSNNTVFHVGAFLSEQEAIKCMHKVSNHNKCSTVSVWGHLVYQENWDGTINYNNELTYGLNDD